MRQVTCSRRSKNLILNYGMDKLHAHDKIAIKVVMSGQALLKL